MARIAIIALMLFAAAPALAQQSDTAAPAQTDPSKNAPHPNPLSRSRINPTSAADNDRTRVNPGSVAGGERERTEMPAAPPSAATETPPPATADAPPAAAPSGTTEAPPAAPP